MQPYGDGVKIHVLQSQHISLQPLQQLQLFVSEPIDPCASAVMSRPLRRLSVLNYWHHSAVLTSSAYNQCHTE